MSIPNDLDPPPVQMESLHVSDPEVQQIFNQRKDWSMVIRQIKDLDKGKFLKLYVPGDIDLPGFRTRIATMGKRIHGVAFRVKTDSKEGAIYCFLSCAYCAGKGMVCFICKENSRNCKCRPFVGQVCPKCLGNPVEIEGMDGKK